jgi:hypothetical protein
MTARDFLPVALRRICVICIGNGCIALCAGTLASNAVAQIYTCTAADGSRIYSDERCGPDAKVVRGIETKQRAASKKAAPATAIKAAPKSTSELESLSQRCDAGDTKACDEWTRGGGFTQLRADERKLEQACHDGSLPACEERYCRDGATKECRSRVQQTASASGSNWYLRTMLERQADGATPYEVRCLYEGSLETRDVSVTCSAMAGPSRCHAQNSAQGFASFSEAALRTCAAQR